MVLDGADRMELVNDAFASNIHWSVKLEGNDLSLEDVKKITTKFTEVITRNNEIHIGSTCNTAHEPKIIVEFGEFTMDGFTEQELKQFRGSIIEVLNHLYSFFSKGRFEYPWSMSTMIGVHKLLMTDTGIPDPGIIRNKDIDITGEDGFEYFIPCPHIHVMSEAESLLEWLKGSPYDELVTPVLFFHEFESIHPFVDGNGRTGRMLFHMMLQELGLKNSELCRFEYNLLSDPGTYYTILAYTDETADYAPLVMYVAEAVLDAYREAVSIFGEKDRLKDMDDASRALVQRARTVRVFTVPEACGWLTGTGEQTIRAKLNEMVKMGILKKEGRTRSQRLSFNDPVEDIRQCVGHLVGNGDVRIE
ncbi:MAG: Fic family protein [Candidatus Methanoplasma sp.]|jgi:Fic family protein|nr:Fic family protein [Candidatus Methanoplasma sp.]